MHVEYLPFEMQERLPPLEQQLVDANKAEFRDFMNTMRVQRMWHAAKETLQTSFTEFWEMSGFHTMLDELQGRTVVDLGCAEAHDFRRLLESKGAGSYIGVDQVLRYASNKRVDTPFGIVTPFQKDFIGIDGVLVAGDMLDFAARLPDGSCSFAINGIDENMVATDTEYGRVLTQHIARATEIGGYVTGVTVKSGILERLADCGMFDVQCKGRSLAFYTLQKLG